MSREAFFHSDGTTALETFSIIVPSFFLVLITNIIVPSYSSRSGTKRNVATFTRQFLIEFFLLVIPIVLIITVLAESITIVLCALIVTAIVLCYTCAKHRKVDDKIAKSKVDSQIGFLTVGRSVINLISVASILAVDFKIFPRKFAKTQTFGHSLMDVGVGLFVFSNGIVVAQSQRHRNGIIKTCRDVLPLLVLGLTRFVITKESDYYVPVSEYGVHWNFFITLALTKILASFFFLCIPIKNSLFLGICILLVHEILLQLGLAHYVLGNRPRNTDFVDANREGIVSGLGYVSLHFLSVAFGYFIETKKNLTIRNYLKLALASFFLLYASSILQKYFGVSRRLANSGYCVWILFLGVIMISLFHLGELTIKLLKYQTSPPLILEAINYNGLFFFLLANVLTGCVNLMWNTLQVDVIPSLVILLFYMLLNTAAATLLYYKNIKIKF